MQLFGAGVLSAVPLQDANGAAIANPTPSPFGILQDVTLDFDFEAKPLYGANQFPVAVGRGKGKVSGKARTARIFASLFNSAFWGQTLTTGYFATYDDTVGAGIPATPGPYTITPTPPASGTWDTDLGVLNWNGQPMTRVASAPATGEYSVAAGVYTFASADQAKTVYIRYRYSVSATGKKSTVTNVLMGYAPILQVDLSVSYSGKFGSFRFPNALPSKFSFAFKNDDWTIPDFDFECFADSGNNVCYYSFTE